MLRLRYSGPQVDEFISSLSKQVFGGVESRLVEAQGKAKSLFKQYLSGALEIDGKKINVVTGRLLRGAFVELVKKGRGFEFRIGSTAPYAIFVFRGTRKMSPRPADLKVAEEILKWLKQAF